MSAQASSGAASSRAAGSRPTRSLEDRLSFRGYITKLRYRWLPDHVIGELLAKKWIDNVPAVTILFLVLIIFGFLIPGYFTPSSLSVFGRELGEFGLVAFGEMLVIVGGGIDLSVGSIYALANFLALWQLNIVHVPAPLAMLLTVLACAAVGLVNGMLIGFLRLRAFLTTLVTLIVVRACVNLLLVSYSIQISLGSNNSEFWGFLGNGYVIGLPFSFFVLLLAGFLIHIYLSRTRPGWRLLAVGGSRKSAYNVGLPVRSIVCWTYVASGALAGLAGFLYAARLSSLSTGAGVGLEISAIAAAILGGNSLGGGRGSAMKAALGALIILLLTNNVMRLGLSSGAGQLIVGLALGAGLAIDVRWRKNIDKMLGRLYISPTFVKLPPAQSTEGSSGSPFALNERLGNAEAIGLADEDLEGPEDVILDDNDNLYCVTRFGDIFRYLPPTYERRGTFCHPGGHPLGMAFAKNGDLCVCIGGMGLYAISTDGVARKLTDETNRSLTSVNDDSRLRLADDCDIAPDGKIYFSEATRRYEMHEWAVDALEGRGNGRLLCYDPATNRTTTVLDRLIFANGVCLAHDKQSVLFAESWRCSISRYWIDGPKKGTVDLIIDDLPGYPDNINRSSDGKYWLAIMGMRGPALELALEMPGFRKRMSRRLPQDEWLYPNLNAGCVVKFDDAGNISDALWDFGGENHPMITSMREHRGYLYIGGIMNNRVGRIRLPGADVNWTGYGSYWGDSDS